MIVLTFTFITELPLTSDLTVSPLSWLHCYYISVSTVYFHNYFAMNDYTTFTFIIRLPLTSDLSVSPLSQLCYYYIGIENYIFLYTQYHFYSFYHFICISGFTFSFTPTKLFVSTIFLNFYFTMGSLFFFTGIFEFLHFAVFSTLL